MADGTDPSRFQVYVLTKSLFVVCETCDTQITNKLSDPSLLDLTDAARTHVCDPARVAAVEKLISEH